MSHPYYYIPPNQITNNTFVLQCNDYACILDTDLRTLETLSFKELQKISQKVKVLARRRHTKESMISEIESIIVFEIPEEGEYVEHT